MSAQTTKRPPKPSTVTSPDRYAHRVQSAPGPGPQALIDWRGEQLLLGTGTHRFLARSMHIATRTAPSQIDTTPTTAGVDIDSSADGDGMAWGGWNSFLVDAQGIDSFLHARAKYFDDAIARTAATALGLAGGNGAYLRIGAAGAPPGPSHPGGEVVEDALVSGSGLAGWTASVCGYLPDGADHSRSVPLAVPGTDIALDERSVYSHTAFLTPSNHARPHSFVLRLRPITGRMEVLKAMREFLASQGIHSYAIRLACAGEHASTASVTGRVLRRLPQQAFRTVAEAGAIASEQTFGLQPGQRLEATGTYWPRWTPDWEAFRGGKPYEPRGHLHFRLTEPGADQHAVAHLRALHLEPGDEATAIITPASKVIAIEPVEISGESLVSRASRAVVGTLHRTQWRRAVGP